MSETVTITIKRFSDIQCMDDAIKTKRDKYSLVYKQVEALVEGEDDRIANMSFQQLPVSTFVRADTNY